MITSFTQSTVQPFPLLLMMALFLGFAAQPGRAAEKFPEQTGVDRTHEFSPQQLLEKAKKQWNALKYSDDVEALTHFSKQYNDTAYAANAERRIKYL